MNVVDSSGWQEYLADAENDAFRRPQPARCGP